MCIRDRASFDIVNLYTNVPVIDTLRVLRDNLVNAKKLSAECIMEVMDLLDLLLNQNYFTHNKEFYSQLDGVAMGSPLSGLLADVYFCLLYTSRCV